MQIHITNSLKGVFNSLKNCWEFKLNNQIIRTCEDNELNKTIYELLEGV